MLLELARCFGIEIAAICLIGDTESDRSMSEAAGCTFFQFVSNAYLAIDSSNVFHSWSEIGNRFLPSEAW